MWVGESLLEKKKKHNPILIQIYLNAFKLSSNSNWFHLLTGGIVATP